MNRRLEDCPRCSGHLSDMGEIVGHVGYFEVACVHCGWSEYSHKPKKKKVSNGYFEERLVPHRDPFVEYLRGKPYGCLLVCVAFKNTSIENDKIVHSSRCPFCIGGEKVYISEKTDEFDIKKVVCEIGHVWYLVLRDREVCSWKLHY